MTEIQATDFQASHFNPIASRSFPIFLVGSLAVCSKSPEPVAGITHVGP